MGVRSAFPACIIFGNSRKDSGCAILLLERTYRAPEAD
jgi:hypothetical protein